MKIPVLIFFGATASGKTDIASKIFSCNQSNLSNNNFSSLLSNRAEIVSADSIQVYKELKIGSAHPSKKIMEQLPHHLISIQSPNKEFSVSDFVKLADKICIDIFNRNKLPVLLGGTAFFLKNFIYGLPITPESNPKIREHFQKRAKNEGGETLLTELKKIDPKTAEKLHKNDIYRITRAHEVFATTGKPLSSYQLNNSYRNNYDFFIISIDRPREILYKRIEKRVDHMIATGLADEIDQLYQKGYRNTTPALKAIGYQEFFMANGSLKPKTQLENIIKLIKRNTKRYAKRQETFFKTIQHVNHYDVENKDEINRLYSDILSFFQRYF